jgi:hypothetical protein
MNTLLVREYVDAFMNNNNLEQFIAKNATIVVIRDYKEVYSGMREGYMNYIKNNCKYDNCNEHEINTIIENIMKIKINNEEITVGISDRKISHIVHEIVNI